MINGIAPCKCWGRIQEKQASEERIQLDIFGKITKVFVNGGEVKPWHVENVLRMLPKMKKVKGIVWSRINGECVLRISTEKVIRKRICL